MAGFKCLYLIIINRHYVLLKGPFEKLTYHNDENVMWISMDWRWKL